MERQGYVRRYENAGVGPCFFFAQRMRFSGPEDLTMFGKDFDASNSLNAEAMEILRGLLQQLRTKPAGPGDWIKAASPQHWNLQQVAQAKRDVVARYAGVFSAANLEQLDRDTILGFLKFQNNHHWYGLERHGDDVTKDMSTLRQTLTLLVDETVLIGTRLARIRPQTGSSMVKLLKAGFELTPVRILEILVWTETEMNGYYRPR
jgi:hypothetical protein